MALAVLRLEGEDTDYVLQEYELDPILRQAVRRFSTQFIRRRIRLDYKPTEFRVLTDEKWLLFVVEQIISNALKYTKKGGTVYDSYGLSGDTFHQRYGHWHRAGGSAPDL